MARYRRKTYRKRGSGKWSTRLTNISGSQLATAGQDYIIRYQLAANPAQSDTNISQKYTVKNIKCHMELESDNAILVENLQVYIMFIPQGYLPDTVGGGLWAQAPFNHPEWILAYRFFGSAKLDKNDTEDGNTFPPLRLSSRLARKLDTGDRIMMIILGHNHANTQSVTLEYKGLVKMNTKAN